MKINLGAGCDHRPGYIAVDRYDWDGNIDIICDFEKEPLPFCDNSQDEVYCAHVFEHLSNPMDVIKECFRILKPGGLLHIVVPYGLSAAAHVPMHKNYWSIASINLFNGNYHEFGKWKSVIYDVNFANASGIKQLLIKPIIKRFPVLYEAHIAAVCPVADLHIRLIKQ